MSSRILVIEDNAASLELMTYLLSAYGHVTLTARDGHEGLAVARRDEPDLIVCDVQLPAIDGYAVARALKADAALRAIPLVAVTALAMVGDRDKVLAAGFNGYISKPIDPETFVPLVEAFLPGTQSMPPPPAAASSYIARPAPTKGATILVVDDLPVNLSLKRSILEPVGYSVLTAQGMAQAMDLAQQTRPDLIISDVEMSDGTGFDFVQRLKADPQLKSIPLIFVTATHCNAAARQRGLALGAARFLFRPLEPERLLIEIEACLREN